MKKLSFKRIFGLFFLLLIFTLTMVSVFEGENFKQVWALICTADLGYTLPAIACVIFFILGESAIFHYLLRILGARASFFHCSLYSFIGFFYSCITPSASGGQPMQAIAMRKDNIPIAVSSVVLAIVTITYKLVLVVVGAAVMIIRPEKMMVYLDPVAPIIYTGLALNIVCVLVLLFIVFSPSLVRCILSWFLSLAHKIKPSLNFSKLSARLDKMIGQYQGASDFFLNNPHVIVHVFLITFLQRVLLFLITWLVYRALSLAAHSVTLITGLQTMISAAVDMLPLPGGMGASENLFMEIFEPIFGEELVLPGMMLSRGISYYTQVLISGVMTVAANFILRKKRSNSP